MTQLFCHESFYKSSNHYTDIPISLALFKDRDLLTCALYKLMLPPAQDSSSFIHLETVFDAAGLCGFPQLTKSSFTTSIF